MLSILLLRKLTLFLELAAQNWCLRHSKGTGKTDGKTVAVVESGLELVNFELIDIALRGILTGIALVCVSAFWINGAPRGTRIVFTLLALVAQCRTWGNLPPTVVMPENILLVLRYVGALAMVLFTWNFINLFMDEKRHFRVWIGAAFLVTLGLWFHFLHPLIPVFTRVYAVLFTLSFLFAIVFSHKDDLIDLRRRARLWIVACTIVHVLVVALFTTPMKTEATFIAPFMATAMQLVSYITFTFWAVARSEQTWFVDKAKVASERKIKEQIKPTQIALVRQIEVAMQNEIWRQEGLTVSGLAQEVGMPEHQVRNAINQILGHRNFSSFINQARIEAAKKQLSDNEHLGTSVQEIAYSVGFNSIGPFNRAFREETGRSPSDFRNATLSAGLADS